MRRLVPALPAALVLFLLAVPGVALAGKRDSIPRTATASSSLTATPADVHAALLQALEGWPMRKQSQEEGIVKTEWQERKRGDVTYRGRIIAEYRADGYQVLLTVKHEKQMQQAELKPTLGGPSASWMDVDGDYEIAHDVVASVERALGMEEDEVKIGQRPPTPSRPVEVWDCFVSPQAAARILDLKSKRRELVTEVKGMDQQILSAVYDGKMDALKGDLDRIKARKAEMEQQITAIDAEILQLVIAD